MEGRKHKLVHSGMERPRNVRSKETESVEEGV